MCVPFPCSRPTGYSCKHITSCSIALHCSGCHIFSLARACAAHATGNLPQRQRRPRTALVAQQQAVGPSSATSATFL